MSSRGVSKKKSGAAGGGSKGSSSTPPAKLSEPLQHCWAILKRFMENPMLDAFLEPVDWEAYGLLDYPDMIKTPMDLGTIQEKLEAGKYTSVSQFEADMRLVWSNCMTYNRPDSELYQTAEKALKSFEKAILKVKQASKAGVKSGAVGGGTGGRGAAGSVEASRADRLKLSQLVSELSSEQLGQLVEIIQKECPEALNEEDDDEVEIEINNIDAQTLLQLVAFAEAASQSNAVGKVKKQKV